jgi:HupE / UreJ protein
MMIGAALLALLLVVAASPAAAHPAPFSYLDFRLDTSGADGGLVIHDYDVAHDLGVDPPEALRDPAVAEKYREQLTRLMQARMTIFVDGRRVEPAWQGLETLVERQSLRLAFRISGARPASLRVTAALFPYDPVHQTFINVYEDGTLRHQAILDGSRQTADYYAGTWQGTTAVLGIFIPAGIEHILIGPDHVLFLVGLLLLGGTVWRLTTIVTAFTLGHSITLSLAALDIVSPPASVVEPIIALSIVFVGADNLLVQRDANSERNRDWATDSSPRDIRMWIAGVFGLVHGFGFAGVLKEFGLPSTALGWSLFSFNVGVEVGQLVIVAAVAVTLRAIRTANPRLSRQLVVAGSVIVMAAGAYWFVERVFLPGGV